MALRRAGEGCEELDAGSCAFGRGLVRRRLMVLPRQCHGNGLDQAAQILEPRCARTVRSAARRSADGVASAFTSQTLASSPAAGDRPGCSVSAPLAEAVTTLAQTSPQQFVDVLSQKCTFKGVHLPQLPDIEQHRGDVEAGWTGMLNHQLPALLPITSFWDALVAPRTSRKAGSAFR